jgi:hypothetical protein
MACRGERLGKGDDGRGGEGGRAGFRAVKMFEMTKLVLAHIFLA